MTAPVPDRRPLPPADHIGKIACLMINGIGDVICATPAIAALKDRYPRAQLSVIVRPHLRGLLERHPVVDRVLSYEVGSRWKRLVYLGQLRREHFDLWVDLHMPTFNTVSSNGRDFVRNALLMIAAGARYRLAYGMPALRPFLTHAVPIPDRAKLSRDNIADTTAELIDPSARRRHQKFVAISDADRAWGQAALPASGSPRIALFFGSRQSADLWSDRKILEFLALLAVRLPDAEWVLIGGPFEAAMVQRLEPQWSKLAAPRIHNYINQSTFGQTAALLQRCQAYVGTDSGPTHIADACGIPIVALFSRKNYPKIWRPISRRATVLSHQVDCSPCFLANCPVGNKCMELIAPEEVLAALLEIMPPQVGA